MRTEAGAAERPLMGATRIEAGRLRFQPRFPLLPGQRYRAVFHPARLPSGVGSAEPLVCEVQLDEPVSVPTVVQQVYPTSSRLPENLLKFYLHFSAPMSRGEAYQHIHLLDEQGRPVEGVFLELGEELWDPEGKRLTLLLDPARIKRGLRPREELGSALTAGKRYTLAVDSQWPDAKGRELGRGHRKAFTVTAPDHSRHDPATWKMLPPTAATRGPLTVRFPKPLDRALLDRLVTIRGPGGRILAGDIAVTEDETCWRFTPQVAWEAGQNILVVDVALEDLAGNRVDRPFEEDALHPVVKPFAGKNRVERGFMVNPHGTTKR